MINYQINNQICCTVEGNVHRFAASPEVTLDVGVNRTIQVRAGDCIHLPAIIPGVPKPTVTWIKDRNTELSKSTDHMKIVREGNLKSNHSNPNV